VFANSVFLSGLIAEILPPIQALWLTFLAASLFLASSQVYYRSCITSIPGTKRYVLAIHLLLIVHIADSHDPQFLLGYSLVDSRRYSYSISELLLLIDCAKMGMFGNLKDKLMRRRAFGRKGDKDALTVASTSEETYIFELSSHSMQAYTTLFPEDSSSSYLLPELTSLGRRSEGDDTDEDFDSDEDKENERDNVRLLSTISKDNPTHTFAYEFDEYEEELIFEPSFEVALMDPDHFEQMMNGSISTETKSLGNILNGSKNAAAHDDESHLEPIPLPIPLPQKLYDHHGNSFLHVFHDDLSTLYEEASSCMSSEGDNFYTVTVSECRPPLFDDEIKFRTKTEVIPKRPKDFCDDDNLRARWEHALTLTKNGNKTRKLDGMHGIFVSSSSSKHYRTAYEI
jgi:hypothetical protein